MIRKWRPSLAFVLGGALCGTLALSFAGLVAFRYLGPVMGFRDAAFLLAAIIAAATAVLGWLLVRLLLRPINALKRFAMHARTTQVEPVSPPEHFGTRELEATAKSVMEMARTLRTRETTVRSFSDHVTHELKSPVAAIRAAAELLQDSGNLAQSDLALVDQIAGASDQMAQQLAAMRSVVQARDLRYTGTTTLDATLGSFSETYPDVRFEICGGGIDIPMSLQGLGIVLGHLVANSREHKASVISMTASESQEAVLLTITDDGSGISSGNADRIFDPFFTTRREEGGTGMGLSIVQNLLGAHDGQISHDAKEAGTEFTIRFEAH